MKRRKEIKPAETPIDAQTPATMAIVETFQDAQTPDRASLISFRKDISNIPLPKKFTYPFYYEPHQLCRIASEELQAYLTNNNVWNHDFFSNEEGANGGKMFGVLVVQTPDGELSYLNAFSGNLGGKNQWPHFVPPVYDLQSKSSFFKKEEGLISKINQMIEELESSPLLISYQDEIKEIQAVSEAELHISRKAIKKAKSKRKRQRSDGKNELPEADYLKLLTQLNSESQKEKINYKKQLKNWRFKLDEAEKQLNDFNDKIDWLKKERKWRSILLQQRLFEQYKFLNADSKTKSAVEIFYENEGKIPPAGTGECAAPKLLQFAYANNLKPIAMAEFWWGSSPTNEIRQHKQFYPACRSKCEPLLGHMLQGLSIEANPLTKLTALDQELETVYEDEVVAVINKPAGFLSVPGKESRDSVYDRIRLKYPKATGPLLVHRLDMSTSGLILVAKTKEAHKDLQKQFLDRTVSKRYVALLEGKPNITEGIIDLPLRVDLDDRPRQMVCNEYGKPAITKWKMAPASAKSAFSISIENLDTDALVGSLNQKYISRIYFYPITGRTHQLRIHAAHPKGLNEPIIGDELYGKRADRLYLHAEQITFRHPISKEEITITKEAEF